MADHSANKSPRRKTLMWLLPIGLAWITINVVAYHVANHWDEYKDEADRVIARDVLRAYTEHKIAVRPKGDDHPPTRILRYRLMEPPTDSFNEAFPVLLFLHGAGEKGVDNMQQLQGLPERMASGAWRSRFPCFLIAPQCPMEESWNKRLPDLRALLDEVLQDPRADQDRVYVTGLSMGGFGTWAMIAEYPDLFAAAAPICGGGDPTMAKCLADLPIWVVHGAADHVVPVEHSREMVDAVRAAGGDVRYTELADVGHESWPIAYSDPDGVIPWLFRQERFGD